MQWPRLVLGNVPWFVQVQIGVTIRAGLCLTFRVTDGPKSVSGMLWQDGTMWILSKDKRGLDSIFDRFDPKNLHEYDWERIRADLSLATEKPVGYYGPRQDDSTLAGILLSMIGLINLLSSGVPLESNRPLYASVPIHILVGALAIRIALLPRDTPEGLRRLIGYVGYGSVLYGIALGQALKNSSGAIFDC